MTSSADEQRWIVTDLVFILCPAKKHPLTFLSSELQALFKSQHDSVLNGLSLIFMVVMQCYVDGTMTSAAVTCLLHHT